MGDLPRARAAAERSQNLPDGSGCLRRTGGHPAVAGRPRRGDVHHQEVLRAAAEVSSALDSAWIIAVETGSFDDAVAWADRYRVGWPKRYYSRKLRGLTELLRDDPEAARREFLSAAGTTPGEAVSQATDVGYAYGPGELPGGGDFIPKGACAPRGHPEGRGAGSGHRSGRPARRPFHAWPGARTPEAHP